MTPKAGPQAALALTEPSSDEQRGSTRHQLGTSLPAQFLDAASERSITCRIYDVSDDGLCVVASEPLAHDAGLVFVTLKHRFQFRVAWCRSDGGGKEHRVGLKLDGTGADLRLVFSAFLDPGARQRNLKKRAGKASV